MINNFSLCFIKFVIFQLILLRPISATADILPIKAIEITRQQTRYNIFEALNAIKYNLQKFSGIYPEVVDNNMLIIDFKRIPKDIIKNFKHLKRAQSQIKNLANFINQIVSKAMPDERKNRIDTLIELNKKINPIIFMESYIDILKGFYIAYLILDISTLKLLDSKKAWDFMVALANVHSKVHMCNIIYLLSHCDYETLIESKNEDIFLQQPDSLKLKTYEFFAKKNYTMIMELLFLANKQEFYIFRKEKNAYLYNLILTGISILKNIEFKIHALERAMAKISNNIVKSLFFESEQKNMDEEKNYTPFIYSKKDCIIKCVKIKNPNKNREKQKISRQKTVKKYIYALPVTIIKLVLSILSDGSKEAILNQVLCLIFAGCGTEKYDQVAEIWIYINRRCSGFLQIPVKSMVFNFIVAEKSKLQEHFGENFFELCHLKSFGRICDFYKLLIFESDSDPVLEHIKGFKNVIALLYSTDYNTLISFSNQMKFLQSLVCFTNYESQNTEFIDIFFDIVTNQPNMAINICKLYSSQENLGCCKDIMGYTLNILTIGIDCPDLEFILTSIEDFLCNKELLQFPPIAGEHILGSIDNLSCFLGSLKYNERVIKDEETERIANIALMMFFILIDLNVESKTMPKNISNSENIKNIIKRLLKRDFNMLNFSLSDHEPSVSKFNWPVLSWHITYTSILQEISFMSVMHYVRTFQQINMIFIDTLQIRLGLTKKFLGLINSNLHYFLDEEQHVAKIDLEPEETSMNHYNYANSGENNAVIFSENTFLKSFNPTPNNDYEFYLYIIFDTLLTLRRFKFAGKIEVLRLETILNDIEGATIRLNNYDDSILKFKSEEAIFFFNVSSVIYYSQSILSISTRKGNTFSDSLLAGFLLIQNKLYEIFIKSKKYKEAFSLIFYFVEFCNLYKVENLTHFTGFKAIMINISEFHPQYFTLPDEKSSEMILINAIFSQLLLFTNFCIKEQKDNTILTLPLLTKNQILSETSLRQNHLFLGENSYNLGEDIPEYMCKNKNRFIDLALTITNDFPGIRQFIILTLANMFQLSKNYSERYLPLCYYLYYSIFTCLKTCQISFTDVDDLFATHIKNSISSKNFFLLCNIVEEHFKREEKKYDFRFSASLHAAHVRANEMKWRHSLLQKY